MKTNTLVNILLTVAIIGVMIFTASFLRTNMTRNVEYYTQQYWTRYETGISEVDLDINGLTRRHVDWTGEQYEDNVDWSRLLLETR